MHCSIVCLWETDITNGHMISPGTNPAVDPEFLRARAMEYRAMALTATSPEVVKALIRLAERFDALAARQEGDRDTKDQ